MKKHTNPIIHYGKAEGYSWNHNPFKDPFEESKRKSASKKQSREKHNETKKLKRSSTSIQVSKE
jgi:hypothetical protein